MMLDFRKPSLKNSLEAGQVVVSAPNGVLELQDFATLSLVFLQFEDTTAGRHCERTQRAAAN
jgi:hypothetical protein